MALNNTQVRGLVALAVVGVSMAVIAALLLRPLFDTNLDYSQWEGSVGKMISPLVGLIGVIIGYYFGRRE